MTEHDKPAAVDAPRPSEARGTLESTTARPDATQPQTRPWWEPLAAWLKSIVGTVGL